MKKTLYLVRHGEKVPIQGDPPLSKLGHTQAENLGIYLRSFPITKIITSPLRRTKQTAEHVSQALNLPFEVSNLLRERANWGDQPGQTAADFNSIWTAASQNRDWLPPVGNSSRQAGQKLEQLIHDVFKIDADHILLVTHGGIVTDFLRNIFKLQELNNFIPNFEKTLDENIKECSVTIVEVTAFPVSFRLIQLADTSYLV